MPMARLHLASQVVPLDLPTIASIRLDSDGKPARCTTMVYLALPCATVRWSDDPRRWFSRVRWTWRQRRRRERRYWELGIIDGKGSGRSSCDKTLQLGLGSEAWR